MRSYSLYENVFIRTFIYCEINTFGLPKLSKLSYAFDIFVLIPVQEMVCLKVIQKITPMDVSVSETMDQKTYLRKFRRSFSPLSPPCIRLCCGAPFSGVCKNFWRGTSGYNDRNGWCERSRSEMANALVSPIQKRCQRRNTQCILELLFSIPPEGVVWVGTHS